MAGTAGDPNRLIFALDSQGMLCGANNTYRNTTLDLTTRPNLYYLNALDLLNPVNMLYAKTVCVSDCPTTANVCSRSSMPCTQDAQYR
jgi:choline transporter-like protein 2/4/5